MVREYTDEEISGASLLSRFRKLREQVASWIEAVDANVITYIGNIDKLSAQVDGMQKSVDKAVADSASAVENAENALVEAEDAFEDGSFAQDTVSVSLKMKRGTGIEKTIVGPIASGTQSGFMNAQTFNGIRQLQDRVTALEQGQNIYYATFASDNPTQEELTTAFQTASGRAPTAGDYITDIGKNITYGYNGTEWVKVESGVTPVFTNASAGLIKGNDQDGTVFAEADGTGSVKGWDELVSVVNGKQAKLNATNITLTSAGWVETDGQLRQSVAIAGMTSDAIVWAGKDPLNTDYDTFGVTAIGQSEGFLTFKVDLLPGNDIDGIVIYGVI